MTREESENNGELDAGKRIERDKNLVLDFGRVFVSDLSRRFSGGFVHWADGVLGMGYTRSNFIAEFLIINSCLE